MQDGKPFAFAGLWDTWQPPEGEKIVSCTIITTNTNSLAELIHDRMPVILAPDSYDRWLEPSLTDLQTLRELLKPYDSKAMKATPVSSAVNNPINEKPECIAPIT